MEDLKVSEIQIVPIRPRDGLIGFASFIIYDRFFVGGIGIHSTFQRDGYRLLYPSKITLKGSPIPIFHPLDRATGDVIEQIVAKEYEKVYEKMCLRGGTNNAETKRTINAFLEVIP